ncbi:Phosphotransferase enzyme family protein [Thalassovita gelatinovora]|uniref:Phosphotransferase enzyme family protein n=1 Tax=Thalassovita gelatinovora TaxID=53501 RepID=A0A0P1FBI9_THAGE|nr:phosphotransferase family protein [Thalassovita gelatinovora]QIZ80766.1 phosphotransferase family protein [Thalassovita gelatinovora]CUH65425.1 Phosphotransferase enzyme family protein [Thalassovita gelatinovora]SEQ90847.1 Predicted kinase, aminoglycoside phosphotransferase (APT) family [Thalassovita gelatinovora]
MTKADPTKLDTEAVAAYLRAHLKDFEGPLEADKFDVGQSNPTFRLRTPKKNYVLRRKPPGVLLKSAHAVDREFRVQSALQGTDVPVAKMHLLCEDDSVIGSAFYVMEEVIGRHFNDPRLPELSKEDRLPIVDETNRVLAAIHNIDLVATGLSDYGPEGNYYRRQIDRWTKQYRASETDTIPAMDELISWLDTNIPAEDGQRTLVHGDYRIDNMLFNKDRPECAAVLDWELSTTGHPYADLAAVIMQWSMPPGAEGRGLAGVDRSAQGLMSDEGFVDAYCARRNLAGIDKFGFYLAFTFFRMAGIIQGVYKRALDGNASNPERAKLLGSHVGTFAEHGLAAAKTV